MMLTKDEELFLEQWAVRRTKKRRTGFNVGFPVGVLIVFAIFINIITGWHKQAASALRSDSTSILVIVIAAVGIVVFMSVFAARYQWEQKEQRYNELLVKKNHADAQPGETK